MSYPLGLEVASPVVSRPGAEVTIFALDGVTYGSSPGAVPEQVVELAEHEGAPLYAHSDIDTAIGAWLTAVDLGKGIDSRATDIRSLTQDELDLLLQTSLVNLYFFLRYVASYSNPYNELSPTLHAEMCNFRQRGLEPGSRLAAFLPRSSLKSSIFTHGGGSWELLRNADLRLGLYGSAIEISLPFAKAIQRVFDSNELVALIAPETTPSTSRDGTWNDKFAIMPNRSRSYPEPSLRAYSASGTTASTHVDFADFDDIVSEKELTATREASAEMHRRREWLPYAISTLLRNATRSRVLVTGTRYDIADPYEQIMLDCRERFGDWTELDQWYPTVESGAWTVYYRSARSLNEYGEVESISPEKYPIPFLEKLAKVDSWSYIMQYVNNPHALEKVEFANYEVGKARLGLAADGSKVIQYMGLGGAPVEEKLSDCDVVLAVDPAASSRRVNAATSKSAVGVVAGTPRGKVVILRIRAGYFGPVALLDAIFEEHARFSPNVRLTPVEMAGPFKFLEGIIRNEEVLRKHYINLFVQEPLGDKLGTIRGLLEPVLRARKLLVVDECYAAFMSEFGIFPSAALDILDMTKIALKHVRCPEFESDSDFDEDDDPYEEREYAYAGTRRGSRIRR